MSASNTSIPQERVLFRHKARLFVMSAQGQWVERGTGDAKVLLHLHSKRTRLVMRKDKTTTILLNQLIQPDAMLLPAKSENDGAGRAFVFEAEDFSSGSLRRDTFALRFKTDVIASEFADIYRTAQTGNKAVFDSEAEAFRQSGKAPSTSPEQGRKSDSNGRVINGTNNTGVEKPASNSVVNSTFEEISSTVEPVSSGSTEKSGSSKFLIGLAVVGIVGGLVYADSKGYLDDIKRDVKKIIRNFSSN